MAAVGAMVWTDFGGVLTGTMSEGVAAFARSLGVEPGRLFDAMRTIARGFGTDDVLEPLDTPLVTEALWAEQLASLLGTEVAATALSGPWYSERPVDQEWVRSLRGLSEAGVRLGLLSNMVPGWDSRWRQMVDPVLFDEVVLSYAVGARKPDREIFDLARRRAALRPSQCVLVDDLDENCRAAARAGWRSVHFHDAWQAGADVHELLGLAS